LLGDVSIYSLAQASLANQNAKYLMKLLEIKKLKYIEMSFKQLMANTKFSIDHYMDDATLNLFGLRLTSLEGCPQRVWGLRAGANEITSLEGISPNITNYLDLSFNPKLTNLHDVHRHLHSMRAPISARIIVSEKLITSSVLGLIYVTGLTRISDPGSKYPDSSTATSQSGWTGIVTKHLAGNAGPNDTEKLRLYSCQEELIAAGFDEHAKL